MMTTLLLVYFFVVVVPVVFWLWFFRSQDRAEPEPKILLFRVFLGGLPVVILASLAEGFVEGTFFGEISQRLQQTQGASIEGVITSAGDLFGFLAIYFMAGPIEEFMKYFVLRRIVYKKINFNQIADGVIYAITIALSFSLIENTIYFVGILKDFSFSVDFLGLVMIRGLITTMLHVVATAIMGLYLGRAKFAKGGHRLLILKGVVLASLVHGLFNLFIFIPGFGMLINLAVILLSLRYILRKMRTHQAQMVWRLATPAEAKVG